MPDEDKTFMVALNPLQGIFQLCRKLHFIILITFDNKKDMGSSSTFLRYVLKAKIKVALNRLYCFYRNLLYKK